MLGYAEATGLFQALWNGIVWVLVVLTEFVVIAAIVAPRAVARKLTSVLRSLIRRATRALAAVWSRSGPAHPTI